MKLRPMVKEFAYLMEARLRHNDHKDDQELKKQDIMSCILMKMSGIHIRKTWACVDAANYLAMYFGRVQDGFPGPNDKKEE